MKVKVYFFILLSFLSLTIATGQKSNRKIAISGYVMDASQRPVVNAIVLIDDKKTSSFTNSKGYYKIKVKPDAVKIGILTFTNDMIEETIGDRTLINITIGTSGFQQQLNRKNSADEEEVNIGYGTVKKKNLSGQVGSIDGTNKRFASYNSIYEMIRGEVSGVSVKGNSINIQGATSLYLSTEPLFVVDGVPVGTIEGIQPQTVKSIEVLKGSSASIYGARGANGVILINLKSANDLK